MTLSSTFNILNGSFKAFGVESATIASNVSNANTPGYSKQVANVITSVGGGVFVDSITRDANASLTAQVQSSTSEQAMQNAISNGLTTLAQTVDDSAASTSSSGSLQNGNSPSAALGTFQSAMVNFNADPSNITTAQSAVDAAQKVASSLNTGSQTVAQVRTNADQQINADVNSVNSLLDQFQTINNSIVLGISNGSNVSSLQDNRDKILSQISKNIGITTSTNSNGSMSIYIDSGVTLFEVSAFQLSFQPSGSLSANTQGNQVTVNGQAITGSSSNVAIQSGEIAGLIQLRDSIAPQYQSQLDQISGNLIQAFQETDQSTTNTGLPPLPGLFTSPGLTSVPQASDYTGLSSTIQVNPSVDASQGGNPMLLRDGGISDTTDSNYTYNTNGYSSYTDRIQNLIKFLSTNMNFSSSAGLGTSSSISDYANSSVSWLQAANQNASNNAAYQQSLLTQASSALNNATGVNLDSELTNMLSIESSYTTSAKLLTTATSMLQTLISSVN